MIDSRYLILRKRAEARLKQDSQLVIAHQLLFAFIGAPMGVYGFMTHPQGSPNGVIYWVMFFWSIAIAIHTGYHYFKSGAWHKKREAVIEQTIVEANERGELEPEEMLPHHLQLEEDIRQRAYLWQHLGIVGASYLFFMPVMLVILLIVNVIYDPFLSSRIMHLALRFSHMGVMTMGASILPVMHYFRKSKQYTQHQQTIYAYKRKRQPSYRDGYAQAARYDDGEINLADLIIDEEIEDESAHMPPISSKMRNG